MSNLMKAQELWAIAWDAGRAPKERVAAWSELQALRAKMKVGFAKIGVDPDEAKQVERDLAPHQGQTVVTEAGAHVAGPKPDPLEEDAAPAKAKAAKHEPEVRGKISEMVRRLLTDTDAGYADIVEQVRRKHPSAVTTTRSVASVASEMRAKGLKVPTRRVAAGEKAK
jgi:hypothetical protein